MKEGNRQEASGNRRKVCVYAFALCSLLLACCSSAYGQRTKRIPGIGDIFVSGEPNAPGRFVEAFRQGLRDMGYTEGKNILIESCYAVVDAERVRGVRKRPRPPERECSRAIEFWSNPLAKQATSSVPIVMITSLDPVQTGLIDSLARPGGNITGVTGLSRKLTGNA
jgi:putative ABC transport system substrate-binding protein